MDSFKTTLFKPDKKRTPTLSAFFHPFRCSKNLTITSAVYPLRHQYRHILNFPAPTTLKVDPVNVNIGIFSAK